jgi:hypothetical protein
MFPIFLTAIVMQHCYTEYRMSIHSVGSVTVHSTSSKWMNFIYLDALGFLISVLSSFNLYISSTRSQLPPVLRRRFTAAPLLGLWLRIQPGALMFILSVLCVVRERSLWRADHASRGVLSTVFRRCVWSRNLKNEEVMASFGPQRNRRGYIYTLYCQHHTWLFI